VEIRVKTNNPIPKLAFLYKAQERGRYEYFLIHGGRGGGKTEEVGRFLVLNSFADPGHILCTREVQNSIDDSVKATLEAWVEELGLSEHFHITKTELVNTVSGAKFLFKGMNAGTKKDSIKSIKGIKFVWCEEAQSISAKSLEKLNPSIREPGRMLIFTFNPDQPDDAVNSVREYGDKVLDVEVNYTDNPYCPDVLLELAERDKTIDPELYAHVWGGEYWQASDAQIFRDKYEVREFDIEDSFGAPYHGVDFGFSQDPTTGVRAYAAGDTLYVSHEAGKVGLELDHTHAYLASCIPGIEKFVVRADSARPESISYLRRHGMPLVTGVKKGKGSVEDGIAFIRSFRRIVVHPRCVGTIKEFRKYSYKVDPRTGDVLPIILDANNHFIDALRYALRPLMAAPSGILVF